MVDTHLEYKRLIDSGHTPLEAESIIEGLRGVSGENLSILKEMRQEHKEMRVVFNDAMISFSSIRRDVNYIWLGIGAGFTIVIGMLGILIK